MGSEAVVVGATRVAELWIGSKSYAVQSYELVLTHNGIPELRAVIDAYHDPWEARSSEAVSVDLPEFYSRYHELNTLCSVYPRTKASFKAVISYLNPDDDQELLINDWLLSGVGLLGVAASGGEIGLRIRLRHPAAVLEDVPAALSIYPGAEDPAVVDQDIVSAIYSLAEEYRNRAEASTTDAVDTLGGGGMALERYSAVVAQLRGLLAPDETKGFATYPGAELPPEFSSAMIPALWTYFRPQTNQTYWDWLSHTLFSEYSISMVPSYWSPSLRLRPFEPWGPMEALISHSEISEMQQPSLSVSTVAGVDVVFEFVAEADASTVQWKVDGADITRGHVFYVEPIAGAIPTYGLPRWFQFATSDARRGTRPIGPDGTSIDAPSSLNYEDSEAADAAKAAIYETAELLARNIFMEEFRRTDEIMLTLPLTLRTPGSTVDPDGRGRGHLVPGIVAGVFSVSSSTPLLLAKPEAELNRFYISAVTHAVDCKSNLAYTVVKGSYVRSADSTSGIYMSSIKALRSDGTYKSILYSDDAKPKPKVSQPKPAVYAVLGIRDPLAPQQPLVFRDPESPAVYDTLGLPNPLQPPAALIPQGPLTPQI